MSEQQRIQCALSYIPAHDRETWTRMGMAVKAELGDEGFDLWDEWSQSSDTYNERDAKSVWRSIKPNGKVTGGTLFFEAKQRGYKPTPNGNSRITPEQIEQQRRERAERAQRAEAEEQQRRQRAKDQCTDLWKKCGPLDSHAYLEVKGVKPHGVRVYAGALELDGMPCDGSLCIAMRDTAGDVYGLQFIRADGERRYLGVKAGHYFGIGKPDGCIVVCEGYATGASIHEATGHAVAVAFDRTNLDNVAAALRAKYPELQIIIAADDDKLTVCKRHSDDGARLAVTPSATRPEWCKCNPGHSDAIKAAQAVGGAVVLPAFSEADMQRGNTDFNDMHKLSGLDAVRLAFTKPVEVEPQQRQDGPGLLSVMSVDTPAHSAPEPLPSLPDVEPLNFNALPAVLRGYVEDISDRMQCPPDFVAAACIAMAGSAIGRQIGIRPKRVDNWTVVPNVWAMIVGRSGIMKSPAMSAALAPMRLKQSEAFKAHERELADFEVSAKVAKFQAEIAEGAARKLIKEGNPEKAARAIEEATQGAKEAPTARRYIINDSTVEALAETLEENPNGILVDRDELAGWLKSLDKEGQQEARAFYLTAADGDKGFTTDRIGRGRGKHIEAVCVSIAGAIQPGVLAHYVRDTQREGSGDDGLLQRFGVMVYPDVSPEWKNVDRAANREARQAVDALIARLCNLDPGQIGAEVDPYQAIPYLHFDGAAQGLFDEWREDLEKRLRGNDEHPAVISHLSKYRKLVPSLALINHLCESGTGPISEKALAQALQMAVYLESHARRVYSYASRPDVDGAKTILSKIRGGKLKPVFTARDVYRSGWSGLATPEEAAPAIRLLAEFGYVRENESKPEIGRASVEYTAHPSVRGTA